MSKRIKINVEMDVTPGQALALEQMFKYWNRLTSAGSSRQVGFFVDGDGDFHPNCKVIFSEEIKHNISEDELRKLSISIDDGGNRLYDYEDISYRMSEDYRPRQKEMPQL